MKKTFSKITRLIKISLILIKHGLEEIVIETKLFRGTLIAKFFLAHKRKTTPLGIRLKEALEELGPIFVKFGQMLSTRSDLVPESLSIELAKLQDQVKPFASAQAKQIVEEALGDSIDNIFEHFDLIPLASASVSQVHAARLKDGTEVVVKILRPGIASRIEADIAILKTIAELANRTWKAIRRFKPREIVKEFEKSILGELNLQREAANTTQLRRNFENSALLYVPKVYWPYVRQNILVMERIYGISISDIKALKNAQVDLKCLAERGVEIFFTQVFRDCFFHADMHPGNIFVSPENPQCPVYIAVDCGIVGTLTPTDQRYIAENFLSFWQRDYGKIARLHVESGWVSESTSARVDEFESAIRTICEPIFGLPLKEISFAKFLMHLFQAARDYDIQIQPQLVLLQKTLFYIEGLGRKLYPDLDPWQVAGPFLEDWAKKRRSPKRLLKELAYSIPSLSHHLPLLPELLVKYLDQKNQMQNKGREHFFKKVPRFVFKRRAAFLMFGLLLFINAMALSPLGLSVNAALGEISFFSWLLASGGLLFGVLAFL